MDANAQTIKLKEIHNIDYSSHEGAENIQYGLYYQHTQDKYHFLLSCGVLSGLNGDIFLRKREKRVLFLAADSGTSQWGPLSVSSLQCSSFPPFKCPLI